MYSGKALEFIKRVYDDTQKHADEFEVDQSEKLSEEAIVCSSVHEGPGRVLVIHDDPYNAAINIKKRCSTQKGKEYKMGIVCTASANYPVVNGEGGAAVGAQGFEFELLRISNLNLTLDGNFYPMNVSLGGAIVCPKITIFKKPQPDYDYCDPVGLTAMFLPCQKNPALITMDGKENYSERRDYDKMQSEINNIFILANMYEINCLIISDFGTDLQHNHPVEHVCDMINKAYAKYPVERLVIAIKKAGTEPENDKLFSQYHQMIARRK